MADKHAQLRELASEVPTHWGTSPNSESQRIAARLAQGVLDLLRKVEVMEKNQRTTWTVETCSMCADNRGDDELVDWRD